MIHAQPPYDFLSGATLLIDKPRDWTSFQVVNKVRIAIRKKLGVKKVKVGHSGTLDPLATGLLILCTGKFTKKLHELQGLDKRYEGTITLGGTTPSYDMETRVEASYPFDHIDGELLEKTRLRFIGPQQQVPPAYSAIKKEGKPMYKRARKGEVVELTPRPIEIYNFQLTGVEMPDVDFEVHCSKGTYIRSLAYDFGKAMDSGGYLSRLVRTAIGPYQLKEAWPLDELIAHIQSH